MVKHATLNALFSVWVGWEFGRGVAIKTPEADMVSREIRNTHWVRACDLVVEPAREETTIPLAYILNSLPTCPRCAVLYDEAMTAREELLGRKEAA